jgi:8-oxo-dGTP pyrophosphatase MutT (NUDIX family)
MYNWVGIILVREDDESVLAQHRDGKASIPSPNTWGVCGGKAEKTDKSLKHAAVRELKEETGYIADPVELRYLAGDEFDTPNGLVKRMFYWTIYDGHQAIECREGKEIRFVKRAELNNLDFCDPFHREHLRKAIEQLHVIRIEREL